MSLKIQFGAGLCGPDGWVNYDSSPMLRLQRTPVLNLLPMARRGAPYPKTVIFGDIVKGLPVESASAELVYSSHTLEHLTLGDSRLALREAFRILKPGGCFRSVLPDISQLCRQYLAESSTRPDAAPRFVQATNMGVEQSPRGLAWARSLFSRDAHLWMWDYPSMEQELRQAGFVGVRRALFGDSAFAGFEAVESKSRWDDGFGFEAIKP